MAEKFCNKFGSSNHQLKIGKTFEKKGRDSAVFHSIRYDFTPLSVDEDRMGKLEVQENNSVSVTLPHNNGIDATNYKGQARPASTKECILIIDHETGELTLERLSNQIILKKTRAERPERQGAGSSNSSHPDGASSNPYQVKSEPERPHNPYAVKREPDKPRMMSNGRAQQMKKQSPLPDSPSGSTTNSPVRIPPPQNNKGLSESSDSNSSSSSDSDSESDSNASGNEKNCPLAATMEAASSNTASPFSMPGDVSDLFLPGGGGGGQLPTARPQKHKKPDKMKQKPAPAPSHSSSFRQESKSSLSAGAGGSMPNFTDLGDDLQLTDESDD